MRAPEQFVEQLEAEFPGYRIRWSHTRKRWQIEQQVGRGALPTFRVDPNDDHVVRARDGYWLVCEVCPGTTTPCPDCGVDLKAPALKFAEVVCEACKAVGFDGRIMAGYFPLSESLLDHLRSTDPKRGALERMADQLDAANEAILAERARELHNTNEAIAKDEFPFIFNIPSTGYSKASATNWSGAFEKG